jgi:hypothetical protein
MVTAYNFLASWQLFPEKGTYQNGHRPKSGFYSIAQGQTNKQLTITNNWVTLENQALNFTIALTADGDVQPADQQDFCDSYQLQFEDALNFTIKYFKETQLVVQVTHALQPNGYMLVTTTNYTTAEATTNTEYYHKQLSVLPYSAGVSGAVIKPTKEGLIRHKALTAMEEQTNMQLEQIRKQVELLAIQAQEIQKRKELSLTIYGAKITFQPVIGNIYHLYQKHDDTHVVSMVSPKEWGKGGPFKNHLAQVKLLADHTWCEVI